MRSSIFTAGALLFAALSLVACSDDNAIRSPDLPPSKLIGVGEISCSPASIAVQQTSACKVIGECRYSRVNAEGQTSQIAGACPSDLTFNSSNPGTATVDPDTGLTTGVAPGTTGITASSGGLSSDPFQITVTPACGQTLALTPATATLFSGATASTSQAFTATVTLSNGATVNVSTNASTTWSSSDPALVTLTANQATAALGVAAQADAAITASYTGNVCTAGTPLTATAVVTVRPATIDGGTSGICIDTVPPTATFTGCRADTGAGLTPTEPIELVAGESRQLQIRGRFNNGFECNITDSTTLSSGSTTVATVNDDTAQLTGVGAGTTTVSATFDGITKTRPVTVVVNQVLGNNSLAVFAKSGFKDDNSILLADAQNNKFSCVGANNLVIDGLGNRTPRGSLKAFAYVATCESTQLDANGNCTAPVPDEPAADPTAAAFLATAVTRNVSNLPAKSADLLDDGIVWNSVAGYWAKNQSTGKFSCQTENSNASANVGDAYTDGERILALGSNGTPIEPNTDLGLPQGAFQPNGLVYSDAAVRVGFNCVTATYTNPENPAETRVDGMTVLVLPAVNDILLSGSNDGNALCESLAPLFGSGPLLGLVEVTNALSAITSGLSPLLETLDALPIDSLVTNVQSLLGPLTAPLVDALDNFLIDPVLEPIVCQVTNVVDGLLGLLTGNPSTPQQCSAP